MKITNEEKAAAKRALERMRLRADAEKVAARIEQTTGEPCSCEQVINHWMKNGKQTKP